MGLTVQELQVERALIPPVEFVVLSRRGRRISLLVEALRVAAERLGRQDVAPQTLRALLLRCIGPRSHLGRC